MLEKNRILTIKTDKPKQISCHEEKSWCPHVIYGVDRSGQYLVPRCFHPKAPAVGKKKATIKDRYERLNNIHLVRVITPEEVMMHRRCIALNEVALRSVTKKS